MPARVLRLHVNRSYTNVCVARVRCSAGLAMLNTGELKEGIALVEKGLVHGPGNADLLDVLDKVWFLTPSCMDRCYPTTPDTCCSD
jgi:hypothetical protein